MSKEVRHPDQCPVCGHDLEVFALSWKYMKTLWGRFFAANYCKENTCGVVGCVHQCEPPENDREAAVRVGRILARRSA